MGTWGYVPQPPWASLAPPRTRGEVPSRTPWGIATSDCGVRGRGSISKSDSLLSSGGNAAAQTPRGQGAAGLGTPTPAPSCPLLPGRLFSAKCESIFEPMRVYQNSLRCVTNGNTQCHFHGDPQPRNALCCWFNPPLCAGSCRQPYSTRENPRKFTSAG